MSGAAFCILLALPRFLRSARNGQLWATLRGITYDSNPQATYDSLGESEKPLMSVSELESKGVPLAKTKTSGLRGWLTMLSTWTLYSPPGLRLDIGQSEYLCPSSVTT